MKLRINNGKQCIFFDSNFSRILFFSLKFLNTHGLACHKAHLLQEQKIMNTD